MSLKKPSKFCFYIFISACALYGCERLAHKHMRGFSYLNFTINPPQNYSISHRVNCDLNQVLLQRFTFLGCGGESLVFSSEDDKWVLKVFKKHRLYPFKELSFIKYPELLCKSLLSRQKIYYRFWESLKLQAELCPDLSHLEYIHLPSDSVKLPKILLIDPCGSAHRMDLNKICFVIQKKGELFEKVYQNTHRPQDRICMLSELVLFYKNLTHRKLSIWDNAIYRNLGWIDGRPFLIDTGSLKQNPSAQEIEKNLNDLKSWVLKNDKESYTTVLELIASQ